MALTKQNCIIRLYLCKHKNVSLDEFREILLREGKFEKITSIKWLELMKRFITVSENQNPKLFKEEKIIKLSFYFLLPISRESIIFRSNFWNLDFDGFTRLEVPWIRKSHFQQLVCVWVYVSVISITQKQITAESSI